MSLPAASFQSNALEYNLPMQITRNAKLAAKLLSAHDADHVDVSGNEDSHLVKISEGYQTSAPEFETFRDIAVDGNPTSFAFDTDYKFFIGKEDHALLVGVDIFFDMAAITNSATDYAQDETVYPTYLAERMMGDSYEITLQGERHDKVYIQPLHWERVLMMDTANSERESYEQAVGAEVTREANVVCFPVRMHFNRKKPLSPLAFAEPHALSFRTPTWASLRRYRGGNNVAGSTTALASAPTINKIWARLYYVDCSLKQRALLAARASGELTYHVSVLEKDTDDEFSVTADATNSIQNRDSVIKLRQPAAVVVGVLRNIKDLTAAADVANWASLTAAVISDYAQSANPCPDPFKAQPILYWEGREQGQRTGPRITWKFFATRMHPRLFPSENFVPVAVISHTPHPTTVADHSLGHETQTNLHEPTLYIGFRCMAASSSDLIDGALSPELSIWSREEECGFDASALNQNLLSTQTVRFSLMKFAIAPNFLYFEGNTARLKYQ